MTSDFVVLDNVEVTQHPLPPLPMFSPSSPVLNRSGPHHHHISPRFDTLFMSCTPFSFVKSVMPSDVINVYLWKTSDTIAQIVSSKSQVLVCMQKRICGPSDIFGRVIPAYQVHGRVKLFFASQLSEYTEALSVPLDPLQKTTDICLRLLIEYYQSTAAFPLL